MKLFKSKKGYSPGVSWVYGLFTLFGLGILYIVFSQVFYASLVPTIKNMVLASTIDNATQTLILYNIDKYMAFFDFLPFIIFLVVIIFMIIQAFRKEATEGY